MQAVREPGSTCFERVALVRRHQAGTLQPPVSLLSLGGRAREAGVRDLVLLDGALEGDDGALGRRLQSSAPQAVVLDGADRTLEQLEADLRALRPHAPTARWIVRAPHGADLATAVAGADALLTRESVDLAALLRPELDESQALVDVAVLGRDGHLRPTKRSPETTVTAHSAALAWDLLDPRAYGLGLQSVALVTSRACPPGCPSCHHSYGRSVRVRPLAEVEHELRAAFASGRKRVVLLDEVFDHSREHAMAVALLLAELGAESVELAAPLSGTAIDPELAAALARAGVRSARLEAGPPPRLQGLLRAHQDPKALEASARALSSAGIEVHLAVALGWPGEDRRDQQATAALARRMPWSRLSVRPAWEAGRPELFHGVLPTPERRRVARACALLRARLLADPRRLLQRLGS